LPDFVLEMFKHVPSRIFVQRYKKNVGILNYHSARLTYYSGIISDSFQLPQKLFQHKVNLNGSEGSHSNFKCKLTNLNYISIA